MARPQIKVLGVYRLAVTKQLLQEQFDILYGYQTSEAERRRSKRYCKRQLESVALLEVLVKDPDESFDLKDFTQERDGVDRGSWQAAWAEAFLTFNGTGLLVERRGDPPTGRSFRCAFFLHYYQPDKPLITSYGSHNCPPVKEMPERLQRLVPFVPVD